MPRKMPKQKPGKSVQIVGTPREFIVAVEREFGPLCWDVAALSTNSVTVLYLGPDHINPAMRDALSVDWSSLPAPRYSRNWLNPEFDKISKFAKKCIEQRRYFQTLMLVPARNGANWWNDLVVPNADIYNVGRMKFVGAKDLYPMDLALCHFWSLSGYKQVRWHWDETKKRRAA